MKDFPVLRLNGNITEALRDIYLISIPKNIAEGVDNEVKVIDKHGKCTCPAAISPYLSRIDNKIHYSVEISAAFAQSLWILCQSALWLHDQLAIMDELNRLPINKKQLLDFIVQEKSHPKYAEMLAYLKATLTETVDIEFNHKFIKVILSKQLDEDEVELLYLYPMCSPIGAHVNTLYIYGMAFALLHEMAHHDLGQDFTKDGTLAEELEADELAFMTLDHDLDGKKLNSAMYGLICLLTCLVFVSPSLLGDGIHPLPFKRIFTYYHKIKDAYPKSTFFLRSIFFLWANYINNQELVSKVIDFSLSMDDLEQYLCDLEIKANATV